MKFRSFLLALLVCFLWSGSVFALPEDWSPKAYHPLYNEWRKDREGHDAHINAPSHDLDNWPFLDGQWEGIETADNGDIWFSVSSHSDTEHAQLFRYDLSEDQVNHVADVGQATGEKLTGHAPQDKIHGQMFQKGNYIYTGTVEGHKIEGREYPGGYWLKINVTTGEVMNLGKSMTNDGLLCVDYDPWRHILYGMTNRTGEFVRFDPETREEKVLGVPWQPYIDAWKKSDDPDKPDKIWPRSLTVMVAPDGKVYGARPPRATFWQYDPDTGNIKEIDVGMPTPEAVKKEKKGAAHDWKHSGIHMTRWNEQDQCFYFIRSFDEMLMRFYPPDDGESGRVENVHKMGVIDGTNRYGNRPASVTLVIDDRTVFYTPGTRWGGHTHLQSYNLDTGAFKDYGPIVVEGGRMVNECHSMTAGKNGKLYLVAFVFSIKHKDPAVPWGMRGKYPFHPRLVIVDPETDFVPAGE